MKSGYIHYTLFEVCNFKSISTSWSIEESCRGSLRLPGNLPLKPLRPLPPSCHVIPNIIFASRQTPS